MLLRWLPHSTEAEEGQTFKTEVEVEYMEIYNEKIRDLFSGSKEHKDSMKVREHPKKGVYVEGVIRKVCRTLLCSHPQNNRLQ